MSTQLALLGVGTAPAPISKSFERAIGCEQFFVGTYLAAEVGSPIASSALAQTGTDFHAYRAAYLNHLAETGKWVDQEWAASCLARTTVTDDAHHLIAADIETFSQDPGLVFGTEVYLSVDEQFRALDCITDATPGTRPPQARQALARGTMDLVLLDRDVLTIRDYKTGWSTSNVREYEAQHAAALAFAHFNVERVIFEWEFLRVKAQTVRGYWRSDIEWLQATVRRAGKRHQGIVERHRSGAALSVNPLSGNCVYCTVRCPLRDEVTRETVDLAPVQTAEDARELARRIVVAEAFLKPARDAMKQYLDQHGAVDLGNNWRCQIHSSQSAEYPLDGVLSVLGFTPPAGEDGWADAPRWEIPMKRLRVSATDLNSLAKAKKRSGLREELEAIARKVPRTTLKIGPQEEVDDPAA